MLIGQTVCNRHKKSLQEDHTQITEEKQTSLQYTENQMIANRNPSENAKATVRRHQGFAGNQFNMCWPLRNGTKEKTVKQ